MGKRLLRLAVFAWVAIWAKREAIVEASEIAREAFGVLSVDKKVRLERSGET